MEPGIFRRSAINAMRDQAMSDKTKAETSLIVMLDHPAGIGDHSTGDLHNNLNEALSSLADADDRLEALQRFTNELDARRNYQH